jgi:hypothetical protein
MTFGGEIQLLRFFHLTATVEFRHRLLPSTLHRLFEGLRNYRPAPFYCGKPGYSIYFLIVFVIDFLNYILSFILFKNLS